MSSEAAHSYPYAEWRDRFAGERLRILYYLGLAANPVFLLSDVLFYREQWTALLTIRVILEGGFLLVFFGMVSPRMRVNPRIPLALWILIGNLCIAQMTSRLGGFTSAYYSGLNLVFLAAAVIVPVSWLTHLSAQLGTLAYYYGINLLGPLPSDAHTAAIQNSFFLIWTCIACLFAVFLYERLQAAEYQARAAERRAREELEVSHRKLLELDTLKDQFFANISRELRTPLAVTLGAFRRLLQSPLPKDSQALIQSGLRNTSRLLFLINELLELSTFESGHPGLKKACIDLTALIKNVAANFESSERQRIFIEAPSGPLPLEVDVRRMMKVVYNLLANAFKFSDPQSGNAWIRLRPEQHQVSIEIEDNGIGIAEDQIGRIFDRFYQIEGRMTRRQEGSGIGLALVKEIVSLHGGTVAVKSMPGKGSTFTVTLPRGKPGNEHVVPIEEEDVAELPILANDRSREPGPNVTATTDRDRPLILVVDDNADMRAYLLRLLSGEYRVVTACDGADALETVRRRVPDLIVADMMMPVMSGYDLLKALRATEGLPAIPFIMLTARAGTEARVESFEAGADDYVSKPFGEEELLARIGNQLRIHRQERELEARTVQLQQLYAQLEKTNAELRELSHRKSEFVAIVSHDLRTPLTAVSALVDNLLDGVGGSLTDKQTAYLDRIKNNIWRLIRMVNDLLDLAKIESGTVDFRPKAIAIAGFVESLIDGLQPVTREKALRLRTIADGADVLAQADPDKLSQALTNLIHNACKFTPAGGNVRVEIKTLEEGFIQLCVADTGCGISPEEIPHVFDKFYRGKSGSAMRGAGLGLAIVKHIVELHGGRIWVESAPQEGSRFYLTLPLVEGTPQQ